VRGLVVAATAALVISGVIVVATYESDEPNPYPELPGCPAVGLDVTGSQSSNLVGGAADETWDLTGATWDVLSYDPSSTQTMPIEIDSWSRGCIKGGTILGPVPLTDTRDQWYDGIGGAAKNGDGLSVVLDESVHDNWVVVRDVVVSDYEDAYDFQGYSPQDAVAYLDHVTATDIGDDCLEVEGSSSDPDGPVSLAINNSYFECFTGIAERPPDSTTAQDGTGAQSFSMENSLMWIKPRLLGPNYCDSTSVTQGRCATTADPEVWTGTYGIWKWSNQAAARVAVRDTIFRLDMPSYSSCSSQQWPAGSYDNVTVVWTGAGPYSTAGACTNTLPSGVTLTTDVSVWDDAVAAWQAQ
jgi:hypothetical protein